MNPTVDLTALAVATLVLLFAFWAAVTTRSRVLRAALIVFALILLALMVSNFYTHGGFHAI
jgi:hypothetical protein